MLTLPALPACQIGGGSSAPNQSANTSGTLDRGFSNDILVNGNTDTEHSPPESEQPEVTGVIAVTSTPTDAYLSPGEKATFKVEASSDVTLHYQWYRNGTAIEGATAPRLVQQVNSAKDAGTYKVVISNQHESQSASAQLTVSEQTFSTSNVSPATITSAPKSQAINEGASVSFTVSAKGSNLSYEWKKGGQVLPVTSSTLQFASARAIDQASYSCRVWNENNSVNCGTFTLTVNQKVAITEQPRNVTAYEGDNIPLSVAATGTPAPVVDWYFKGKRVKQNTNTLSLSPLKTAQAGSYKCVVRNSVNKLDCAAANVVVKKKVQITKNLTNQILNAGENIKLDIAATGAGPIQYKCYRDGKLAVSATSSNGLVISNSKGSDSGNYYCDISNSGSSATSATAKITVLEDTTRKITLRWAAPTERENGASLRKVELDKYIIYLADQRDGPFEVAKTVNASSTSAELTGLHSGDYYLAMSTVDKLGMESEKSGVARIDID